MSKGKILMVLQSAVQEKANLCNEWQIKSWVHCTANMGRFGQCVKPAGKVFKQDCVTSQIPFEQIRELKNLLIRFWWV